MIIEYPFSSEIRRLYINHDFTRRRLKYDLIKVCAPEDILFFRGISEQKNFS